MYEEPLHPLIFGAEDGKQWRRLSIPSSTCMARQLWLVNAWLTHLRHGVISLGVGRRACLVVFPLKKLAGEKRISPRPYVGVKSSAVMGAYQRR